MEEPYANVVKKLAVAYRNGNCNEYVKRQFMETLRADLDIPEILMGAGIKRETAQEIMKTLEARNDY